MTKRSSFEAVGGFTEELTVAFNDIDYCLKVRALDELVVYTPEVELYHYESLSRGSENSDAKRIRFHREIAYMNYHWAKYYVEGDPYFSPNFTQSEPAMVIRLVVHLVFLVARSFPLSVALSTP